MVHNVYIYKITNPRGKIYIGSTKRNVLKRWSSYKNLSCKAQKKLYSSLLKYGVENHKFEIILVTYIENIYEAERKLGEFYNVLSINGLNLKLPGYGEVIPVFSDITKTRMSESAKGKIVSSETRLKLSKSLTGKKKPPFTDVHRNNLRLARANKKPSDKSKKIISDSLKSKIPWNKGVPLKEETKKKLSLKNKGRVKNKKSVIKSAEGHFKSIIQLTKNGEFIKKWNSIIEASITLKIDSSTITKCCKNKRKSAGGFIWCYSL